MGKAREVMDRLTVTAVEQGTLDDVMDCYTDDAVLMTPDQGEVRGQARIREYWQPFFDSFSDRRYEYLRKHESGDVAIDEGWYTGTHTGPLRLPSGEVVEPTGRHVRVRGCDIATVVGDKIKEHHLYLNMLEYMDQLGLGPGK